ncbi:MAG: hypothetical protein HOK97_10235 [Deltaproteobacteria bacterium]|nr:hypothetical protein [Deltaproteobacteria bacterium]
MRQCLTLVGFSFLITFVTAPCFAQKIVTDPDGASVFHKVRGKHYFVGYTPLKLTPALLANKSRPHLLILKYGYQEAAVAVDLAENSTVHMQMTPAKIPVQKYTKACEENVLTTLQTSLRSEPHSLHVFPPVIVETQNDKRSSLLVRVQVVNYDDAYAIRRTQRLDAAKVMSVVSQIVESTLMPFFQIASKADCFDKLQVDVEFKDSKRLRLETVQTRTGGTMSHSWDTNIGGDIYRTTKHFNWSGTKVSVEAGIAVDRNKQVMSLQYDFRDLAND